MTGTADDSTDTNKERIKTLTALLSAGAGGAAGYLGTRYVLGVKDKPLGALGALIGAGAGGALGHSFANAAEAQGDVDKQVAAAQDKLADMSPKNWWKSPWVYGPNLALAGYGGAKAMLPAATIPRMLEGAVASSRKGRAPVAANLPIPRGYRAVSFVAWLAAQGVGNEVVRRVIRGAGKDAQQSRQEK